MEKQTLKKKNDRGVSLVGYARLFAIFVLVARVAVRTLGTRVFSRFSGVASLIS